MNKKNESFPSPDHSDLSESKIEEIKKYIEAATEEETKSLDTELKNYPPNILQRLLDVVKSLWNFNEASIPIKVILKMIKDREDKYPKE